jgi:hypothetical protein
VARPWVLILKSMFDTEEIEDVKTLLKNVAIPETFNWDNVPTDVIPE